MIGYQVEITCKYKFIVFEKDAMMTLCRDNTSHQSNNTDTDEHDQYR